MTEEEQRLARAARLQKMRRRKRRQMFMRTYSKIIYPGAGLLLLVLIIGVSVAVHHGKSDKTETIEVQASEPAGIEDTDDMAGTGTPEDEPYAGIDGAMDDADADDTGGESSDSEYGPYAEVYSEDKDAFFDGYSVAVTDSAGYPPEDEVLSTHAVLIDAVSGEVVAAKDANVRIYPASMTKILTLLVAAEHVSNLDDTFRIDISITDYAYSHDCSAVGFACGESVTVRDLMYGTILPSGADAALALAEYVAGDHSLFVDMMNAKLDELGLSGSAHFTNCVGVYDDDHYCTLCDMAMIMKAALENDLAREILHAHIYTTSKTEEHPDGIEISNWFLRRIEDKDTGGEVVCAKTGFVNESGCCGASYEITDSGRRYICVTADAWSSWRCIYDHVAMYNNFAS
ncbi:MAG: D-alanyl-D-alanine carboxypeptidase [Lachnospiraceae bacterium]|nr:D-alanyl-D-alanine carboxypeptidase [Lachnospiraceae bacterium]